MVVMSQDNGNSVIIGNNLSCHKSSFGNESIQAAKYRIEYLEYVITQGV